VSRAIYRILDANLNRSREALRVIEEYCRFVKDDVMLSRQTKHFRHRLKEIVDAVGQENLLAARSSETDIGKEIDNPSQQAKADPQAVVTASCKRLQEALRNIEEYGNAVDAKISDLAGKLRFEAYQLEKDLRPALHPRQAMAEVRMYLLIGSDLCPPERIVRLSSELLEAGVDCLQLREKRLSDRQAFDLARELSEVCRSRSKLFIVNDRPDIAKVAGAHGVHLGQDDLPIDSARLIFPDAIYGISTHNLDQTRAAIQRDPTYIAVGPAFTTATKAHEPPAGLEFVAEAAHLSEEAGIPAVAIGGITLDTIDQVLRLGVHRVAVASAILASNDPAEAVRQFAERLQQER
jgi:thiamine-phosphate pyrophosphorylase